MFDTPLPGKDCGPINYICTTKIAKKHVQNGQNLNINVRPKCILHLCISENCDEECQTCKWSNLCWLRWSWFWFEETSSWRCVENKWQRILFRGSQDLRRFQRHRSHQHQANSLPKIYLRRCQIRWFHCALIWNRKREIKRVLVGSKMPQHCVEVSYPGCFFWSRDPNVSS